MKWFDFHKFIITVLVVGAVLSPYAAALALLIFFGHQTAEKYFTKNISDSDRRQIDALKVDVQKLAEQKKKDGLAQAFAPRA